MITTIRKTVTLNPLALATIAIAAKSRKADAEAERKVACAELLAGPWDRKRITLNDGSSVSYRGEKTTPDGVDIKATNDLMLVAAAALHELANVKHALLIGRLQSGCVRKPDVTGAEAVVLVTS